MVHKRYKLSRLFGTNCVSELFFVSFFSFGLLPPAPKRRLRGEPATVNWGILEAMGSSVMSTLVCRHKGKNTILGSPSAKIAPPRLWDSPLLFLQQNMFCFCFWNTTLTNDKFDIKDWI